MRTSRFLAFACLFLATAASAEVINMKNGDVYRAEILKQEFGNYVQILLKDGSEKRLLWNDISSIEKDAPAPAAPEDIPPPKLQTPQQNVAAPSSDQFPTEMLNTSKTVRFDLDLVGFSYDSTWQKVSIQADGSSASSSANTTNHYVRTVPEEFILRAYLGKWHAYLDFLNASVNSNDINDGSFSTLALAYSVTRGLDLGLGADFDYSSTSTNGSSTSSSISGSDYAVGPFFRVVAPVSEVAAVEVSGNVGLDFRNLTDNASTWSLTGSDVALFAMLRAGVSVSVFKEVSYLFWVDGWLDLGTLSGNYITSGSTIPGTLDYDVYRFRVVPVGLRLKF